MDRFPQDSVPASSTPGSSRTLTESEETIPCGELLRQARLRRGLTVQPVVQHTKLPLRHLEALERDEYNALPNGMYRRAEVRAYAEAVGLDRSLALQRFEGAWRNTVPEPAAQPAIVAAAPVPARTRRPIRVMVAG